MSARIASVVSQSLADKAGLKAGDEIIAINGIEIKDYLDFMYASCQEELEIKLSDRVINITNEDFMPLGTEFETLLIDEPHSCHNKCIFCFIDQLPKNMRSTCYFKDDDYRLSFLQGNYVSMTNMTDEDVDRIIRYNIPRINISVHTTNPELRKTMLHNKRAGDVLKYLDRFYENGLSMNAQIVLCPNVNDGKELDRTLADLGKLGLESISVVPVGLSDHRDGLYELTLFDKDGATAVINQVEKWQEHFLAELGTRLVYLADEFYILAEKPLPDYESYEGFPQIENGVGLCSSLKYEFGQALKKRFRLKPKHKKTVATGKISFDLISSCVDMLKGDKIQVVPIENKFFGKDITVSGLITGRDLIDGLKDIDLGDELLISSSMLRHDEEIFLDDTTLSQVQEALNIKVTPVPNDGFALAEAFLS